MINRKVVTNLLLTLLLYPTIVWSNPALGPDCTINEECSNAIFLGNLISDTPFVEMDGCNLYASPNNIVDACELGSFPTVWYKFTTDDRANALSIIVHSIDFDSPVISVFKSENGCDELEPVNQFNSILSCVIGSNGVVDVIGQNIQGNTTYYISISSLLSIGGDFRIYIRARNRGFGCVQNQSIDITARSNGGPLTGPFDPNEKVSICMVVGDYSAANNGCQWFQGLVPVFGNGWDPSSFNSLGQPLNAMVNGESIGAPGNGLYMNATWDWFDDVDYHMDHPDFNISDFNGDGRLEMCSSFYDPDCPVKGVNGGCCNPCWGSPLGDTLPPGWFAYGINGSCPDLGPPIRVDWGDGNSCGGGQGPWEFCFDLVTRDIPDCMEDSTKRDLSLSFFTFADGETGAWTGSSSVCSNDEPLKVSLEAKCGRVSTLNPEELPVLCSGDTLVYKIEEPNISHWEWNISPFWAVQYLQNEGDNGFTISTPLINESGQTVEITGIFIGHESGSNDKTVKRFQFDLQNTETCNTVSSESLQGIKDENLNKIKVYPMPVVDAAVLEWSFELHEKALLSVYDAQGNRVTQTSVLPENSNTKQFETKDLLPGIYYISFGNAEFQYVTKMVKI